MKVLKREIGSCIIYKQFPAFPIMSSTFLLSMSCPSNQRFDDGAWKERILAPRKKQRYEQMGDYLVRRNLTEGDISMAGKNYVKAI